MYKKFSIFFAVFTFLLLAISLPINIYIDPYNFFDSQCTEFISVPDERKVKLCHLKTHKRMYDSVLIGSSRSSYIDISTFPGFTFFNLSVSGIRLYEYLPYLEFFKETQGSPKLIILSLDFYLTNKNFKRINIAPDTLICDARSPLNRILDCAKIKTLRESFLLVTQNPEKLNHYYTRDMVKKVFNQTKMLDSQVIQQTLDSYKQHVFYDYEYREDFVSTLQMIKEAFPTSTIIVLICPSHQSLMKLQKDITGNFYYQKWLSDIKSVFPTVVDFSENSTITNDPRNFSDAAHFYPFVGQQIIEELKKYVVE